jgi:hypothetical protein
MDKDYIDEDKDFGAEYYEDPEQTIESHWRWVLPILLMVALPAAAMYFLHETSRTTRAPLLQSMLNGLPTVGESGATGTAGRDRSPAEAMAVYSINEAERIIGLADRRQLIGKKVDLHVPVMSIANDQAFWIGDKDHRLLVVPSRDNRDGAQRQSGVLSGNNIASVQPGQMAAISGTIQPLPIAEEAYSWGLTTLDREEVAASGVYLRADTITAQ